MSKWVNKLLTLNTKPCIITNDRDIVVESNSCNMDILWYACN